MIEFVSPCSIFFHCIVLIPLTFALWDNMILWIMELYTQQNNIAVVNRIIMHLVYNVILMVFVYLSMYVWIHDSAITVLVRHVWINMMHPLSNDDSLYCVMCGVCVTLTQLCLFFIHCDLFAVALYFFDQEDFLLYLQNTSSFETLFFIHQHTNTPTHAHAHTHTHTLTLTFAQKFLLFVVQCQTEGKMSVDKSKSPK